MAKAQTLLKVITLVVLSPLGILSGMVLGAISAIRYIWDHESIFTETPEASDLPGTSNNLKG